MCEFKAKCSRSIWGKLETKELLSLMKENKVMNQLDGKTRRNNQVYVFLANELAKKGYKKSSEQVKVKFRSLKKDFFKTKYSDNKKEARQKIKDHFKDLNDLLRDRPLTVTLERKKSKTYIPKHFPGRWITEETKYLLALMKENKLINQLNDKTHCNRNVYKFLANKFSQIGFEKNALQIRIKIRELKKRFYKVKHSINENDDGPKRMDHFEALNEILGDHAADAAVGLQNLEFQTESSSSFHHWRTEETKVLIKLMKDNNVINTLDGKTRRNNEVYVLLANELAKQGYKKSSEQVKVKFRSLKKDFFKAKSNNKEDAGQTIMDHFEDLNDLLCNRPPKQSKRYVAKGIRARWRKEETKNLLALMKDYKVIDQLNDEISCNKDVYKFLANKLCKKGFEKNAINIKWKIRSLKKEFYRIKRSNNESDNRLKRLDHFEALNELLGDRPKEADEGLQELINNKRKNAHKKTFTHFEILNDLLSDHSVEDVVKKQRIWSTEETKDLLELMKEKKVMNVLDGKTRRNNRVYVLLSNELAKKGYKKTSAQIKVKFRMLKKEFFKTKCSDNTGQEIMDHFEELNDLLCDRPVAVAVKKQKLKINKENSSRVHWKREELKYFLALLKRNKVMSKLDVKTRRKKNVYIFLANELSKKGFKKNVMQIEWKIRNLKQKLYKRKRSNIKSANESKSMDQFEASNDRPVTPAVELQKFKFKNESLHWTTEETENLIDLIKEYQIMSQLDEKTCQNNNVYVFLANELAKRGFKKNSNQVNVKICLLKEKYYTTNHSNNKNEETEKATLENFENSNELLNDCSAIAAVENQQLKSEAESNRCSWSKKEAKYLLSLIKENKLMGQLNGKTRRNHSVYVLLASELAKKGFKKNSKQVREKFITLKKQFLKANRTGQKSVEHFEDLRELLNDRPVTSIVKKKEIKIHTKSNRCCWNSEETKTLLSLMKENKVMEQLHGKTRRNYNVYVFLANEMVKKGFEKNCQQIKLKFRTLKKEFLNEIHSRNKSGAKEMSMEHFEDLKELIGDGAATAALKIKEESDWSILETAENVEEQHIIEMIKEEDDSFEAEECRLYAEHIQVTKKIKTEVNEETNEMLLY